jgi:hypothetical protein
MGPMSKESGPALASVDMAAIALAGVGASVALVSGAGDWTIARVRRISSRPMGETGSSPLATASASQPPHRSERHAVRFRPIR